jgi:hypothetical protein
MPNIRVRFYAYYEAINMHNIYAIFFSRAGLLVLADPSLKFMPIKRF